MISRVVLEDTTIGDSPVKTGETLLLMIGAANRDRVAYPDPDVLDLTRRPQARPLGFGLGIHFCLGAPLARLAAQAAIGALSALDLTVAEPGPAYAEGMIVRGLASLPVRIGGDA